jgi:hypothetical protein
MIAEKHVNRVIKSHRSSKLQKKDLIVKKQVQKEFSWIAIITLEWQLQFPGFGTLFH